MKYENKPKNVPRFQVSIVARSLPVFHLQSHPLNLWEVSFRGNQSTPCIC
jgi:hypothetical protein